MFVSEQARHLCRGEPPQHRRVGGAVDDQDPLRRVLALGLRGRRRDDPRARPEGQRRGVQRRRGRRRRVQRAPHRRVEDRCARLARRKRQLVRRTHAQRPAVEHLRVVVEHRNGAGKKRWDGEAFADGGRKRALRRRAYLTRLVHPQRPGVRHAALPRIPAVCRPHDVGGVGVEQRELKRLLVLTGRVRVHHLTGGRGDLHQGGHDVGVVASRRVGEGLDDEGADLPRGVVAVAPGYRARVRRAEHNRLAVEPLELQLVDVVRVSDAEEDARMRHGYHHQRGAGRVLSAVRQDGRDAQLAERSHILLLREGVDLDASAHHAAQEQEETCDDCDQRADEHPEPVQH
eukprot:Rhum_TRINITY_DN10322_c0_g1::Rhum_TRINITY_DN10322_c0_g1_i1::g.38037::m.38037